MNGLQTRAAAVAQFVVADLNSPQLSDEDEHHLTKVLRVRNNETVAVTDGAGRWRMCQWSSGLETDSEVQFEDRLMPLITIGFALTKGSKPELAIQKLTEIGVDVIRPIISTHTVVKWDASKAAANVERFRRVAYEAAMQSRRVWVPVVEDVAEFTDLAESERVLAQVGGRSSSLENPLVIVGPEGGWSEAELATASDVVDLGPTILRAETAALVVAAQLADLRWKRSGY